MIFADKLTKDAGIETNNMACIPTLVSDTSKSTR